MRIFWVSFLLILFLPFQPATKAGTFSPEKPTVSGIDFCRIYGSVYFERDPRRQASAHFTVFEESEEAFANLVVYKEDNKLFADKPGLWYETKSRDFADYIIFISPNRNMADFGVHFTTVRGFAGCKN